MEWPSAEAKLGWSWFQLQVGEPVDLDRCRKGLAADVCVYCCMLEVRCIIVFTHACHTADEEILARRVLRSRKASEVVKFQ